MSHRPRARHLLALLVVVLLAPGCASENKTGSDKVLDFKDNVQQRLGEATATPSARRTTAPPVVRKTAAPVVRATTAAPRRTVAAPQRTQAQAPAFVISINSDNSAAGSQFTPSVSRVYVGQVIHWTNKDTVARSVVADKGQFSSGPIAPGATFSYTANTPGQFSYHDGTRPYAVASLEVLRR